MSILLADFIYSVASASNVAASLSFAVSGAVYAGVALLLGGRLIQKA